MPAFMAYLVASCALFTPSFRKIFFLWLFTVWKLRFLSAAISLVVFPRAISFRMLRSAVVSKSSLMAGWVGEEEPLPASSRLLT